MRVLITGIAGFVGSHIAEAFIDAGHQVIGIDNLSTGCRENVPPGVPLHIVDIRDREAADIIVRAAPDALCHHAAQASIQMSVVDPALNAEVNVVGTLRVLEACRAAGCSRVIFASTGGAFYGHQETFPTCESNAARPMSPYGASKAAIEMYLNYYENACGLRSASLRYANVYGPRQTPKSQAGVVTSLALALMQGRAPVIHGDGEQTRDFVFVRDVARANVLTLQRGLTGAYNVGTGLETSINALFRKLRALIGGLDAEHLQERPGEQRRSCIDARRLTIATGWVPSVHLDEGLAETVKTLTGAVTRA